MSMTNIEYFNANDFCLGNACGTANSQPAADYQPSCENFYEEFENLLKNNKLTEDGSEVFQKTENALPLDINFEFDDLSDFSKGQVLYSVQQNELRPITFPFRVSGIIRNIGAPHVPDTLLRKRPSAKNVVVAEASTRGCIVPLQSFQESYALESVDGQLVCKELQPKNEANKRSFSEQQCDVMANLAHNLVSFAEDDHVVIDEKLKSITRTEYATNQKTIYRLLSPTDFHKNPVGSSITKIGTVHPKPKPGRPRKRTSEGGLAAETDFVRPRDTQQEVEKPPQLPELRTRSGRVVKLQCPSLLTASQDAVSNDFDTDAVHKIGSMLTDLKDSDYRCNKKYDVPPNPEPEAVLLDKQDDLSAPLAASSPLKRQVPAQAVCPTCNKIYLGRRLQRHFAKHPDHMQPLQSTVMSQATADLHPLDMNCLAVNQDMALMSEQPNSSEEEMTLFRFLTAKLQKSHLNEDQRADLFLSEINDLVKQLQLRSSRLIRNTSGLHFVSARAARVLGIPEGQYALDMSAIHSPPDIENAFESIHTTAPPAPSINTRSLDYTALSMDDTLTDEAVQKLNLSAGGKILPPSEESLLRAVGDFVPNAMNKLATEDLLNRAMSVTPHYDHVNDNAVEAVSMKETSASTQTQPILGLSVDFFQFNNN